MPKLVRLSGAEAIKRLERLGFLCIRQKGSHVVLKKITPEGIIGCVVPVHDTLAIGTLRGILRQANISVEDFADIR